MSIIDTLKEHELTAGDLACTLDVSSTSLSQHLNILRNVGVVQARREGKFIYYSLSDVRVVQACNLMSEVLLDRLKNMELLSKQLTEDSLAK
jgi:ArsR family transcriptional regulator